MEKVGFATEDGVRIVGDYYVGPNAKNAAILLHMMPATRESWRALGGRLADTGIAVLAIDLRGHGESVATRDGRRLDYRDFSEAEHQASILDVRAAAEFLRTRGLTPAFTVGASIGANLALQFLAESEDAQAAALLSPGTNYRGIEALPLARRVTPEKKVLIVAAKDDKNVGGAAEMGSGICEALACARQLKIFERGGHGTDLLDAHPEFMEELIKFFKE
ncbi:MAG: alpha/beta fold hydrolase [Candidatus Niyogibacteria bacterium]|nr:alpha/beta fold hydrolase [Candidatus Niyogibacteria bacterium]